MVAPKLEGPASAVVALAFSSDATRLAVCCADKGILVWDITAAGAGGGGGAGEAAAKLLSKGYGNFRMARAPCAANAFSKRNR